MAVLNNDLIEFIINKFSKHLISKIKNIIIKKILLLYIK